MMPRVWFYVAAEDGNFRLVARDLKTGIDTPIGEPQPALFLLELIAERIDCEAMAGGGTDDREVPALDRS